MKLNVSTIKKIVDDLKSKVLNNRIATITVINSHDLLFSFSVYRKEKLLVSLNHNCPFVSLVDCSKSIPTITGHINDSLRKELKDAYIYDVENYNNDRIIKISVQKSNDFYEKENRYIIIELIAHRANLILLDQNNTVLFAYHTSGLETSRPIMRGLKYNELPQYNFVEEEFTPIEEIKTYALNYISTAVNDRLKEKYSLLYKHLKSKIKSIKNKEQILDIEEQKAKQNLVYKDYGDMVLALSDDETALRDYLKENNIIDEYNDSLSFGVNANKFYKKYKKAKRTLEMNKIEREKSIDQLSLYESYSAQLPYMNDEEMYALALELMPNKFKQNKKNKVVTTYSYVEVNNHRIYFGKNANQNEEITFKLAKKEYWYFHIKDYHGAHVVIFNDSPSNEEKLIASEMCLILSNKSAGEVMYSQIKDIKKSNTKGMALLDKYQLIVLHEVRDSTIDLLNKYKN